MARAKISFSEKSKIWIAAIFVLAGTELLLHWKIPFMMDDLWYATNLVTGEPLHGLGDILESQIWHFFNWGGRSVTHGLLQLTLMCPQWLADLFNLGMTLLLTRIICVMSGRRQPYWFLTAFSLLIALNANWKMSMFWQAGTVNYVYSSVWIFTFLWLYIRKMEIPDAPPASPWDLSVYPPAWPDDRMEQ